MNAPLWVVVPVVVLVALAVRADVRTRKIPNALTGPALVLALVAHGAAEGVPGLQSSVTGMLVAGAALMPGWLMRWMGAGDVKLLAAIGAWLAWPQALMALLASLVAGGIVAIVYAARHRVLGMALMNVAAIGSWAASRGSRAQPRPVSSGVRFPFALAAFAGAMFALWVTP